MKKKEPHWYMVTVVWCPACLAERTYRTRRYDPRPENWNDRHEWIQHWNGCEL